LGVLSQFQKKGIGKALIEQAVMWARKGGAKEIVSQNNDPSSKLFQRMGFKVLSYLDVFVCILDGCNSMASHGCARHY
jgi:GNAT superfamily N-acetyltransferase